MKLRRSVTAVAVMCLFGSGSLALADGGPPVRAVTVTEQPITRAIRATGTVTSPRAAEVSTAIAGLVQTYDVDIGDRVTEGQRLVQLDAELAQLELEAADARLAEARTALADARRRFDEAEQLGGTNGVIAATEIESRRAEAAVAEARTAVLLAEVRQQRALVRRHSIEAPFAGVVSERLAEAGEWANPGVALLSLVATDRVQFDFRLPQQVFPAVQLDTPLTISLEALPEQRFQGRVAAVVPVSDPGDRTFLIRAVVDEAELAAGLAQVTPGMSARAVLAVDTGRRAVVVPRDAVLRYPDGRTVVWVVEQQDGATIVRERQVVTDLEFEGLVEIRSGLQAGVRVVTRGNEALTDRQEVVLSQDGGQ